jgi:ABC-2 type transport system ATP-binding protein
MIKVESLTKTYGRRTALDSVSFEVPRGEIFGFVGPNGAGKTTTLRILAALLEPTAGRAFIDGADVVQHPDQVHDRLGYMPDFFGVYDQLTTTEYLDFYAACYRQPRIRRQ